MRGDNTALDPGDAAPQRVYCIDGKAFATLEELYEIVSNTLIPGADWGRNLDAFSDIKRGGFGTPSGGFILRWLNSRVSQQRLGYPETIRQLTIRRQRCHPSHHLFIDDEVVAAEAGVGATVFDWLVEIIRVHGPGGSESEDGVELILE